MELSLLVSRIAHAHKPTQDNTEASLVAVTNDFRTARLLSYRGRHKVKSFRLEKGIKWKQTAYQK